MSRDRTEGYHGTFRALVWKNKQVGLRSVRVQRGATEPGGLSMTRVLKESPIGQAIQ